MKTLTIKLILALTLVLGVSACSSSSDDSSGAGTETTIADVVLSEGKSVSCTDENTFSIEAKESNSPDVSFSTNTSTGVTTITYESTEGSAIVVGCVRSN